MGLYIDEALKDIPFPVEIIKIENFKKGFNISVNVYSTYYKKL